MKVKCLYETLPCEELDIGGSLEVAVFIVDHVNAFDLKLKTNSLISANKLRDTKRIVFEIERKI